MSDTRGRLLGLLFVVGGGCTLTPPDRPNARSDAGASSGAASGNGSAAGPSGASAGTGAVVGGSSSGGTTTDAEAGAAGDATTDGAAGAAGGTVGSGSGCVPECDHGMVCTSGSCACPEKQSTCSKACVDLQTNSANCGACGHACTDKCGGGRCYRTLLDLTSSSGIVYLAVDASYVYFTQTFEGTVSRVPRTGGSAVVLASSQDNPRSLAVDATNVYWGNASLTYGSGSVMKRALSGGDPIPLATGEPWPVFVAADANKVYWSNYPPQPPIFMSVPIAGGPKTQFPMGDELTNAVQFSFDGSNLYWAGWYGKGGVWSTPLDGGGPIKPLTTLDPYASNAVVFGSNVYFFAGSPSVPPTIKKVPTTGGTAVDVVALSGSYLNVDAGGIYVGGATTVEGVANSIVRVSFDGATVTTLAVGASAPYAFALGDTEVFWVDKDLKIKAAPKNP
jgi:hypothetical protein